MTKARANFKVEVEGMDKLHAAVKKSEEEIMDAIRETVDESLDAIRDDAQDGAAVLSGALRDAIGTEVDSDGLSGAVSVTDPDVDYAEHVEFGTSKQQPQPFMTPAAERARQEIPVRLSSNISGALK